MPIKMTNTSDNPNFKNFGEWVEAKKAEAQAANNTAEVQRIQNILDAKIAAAGGTLPAADVNASQAGNITTETIVINALTPTVVEFDELWDQWKQEYNVQTVVEDV